MPRHTHSPIRILAKNQLNLTQGIERRGQIPANMDVERICRTHISSTDELKAPAELVRGGSNLIVISGLVLNKSQPLAVQDGSVGLLDVVRALGEYITSTEDDVRRKGKVITVLQAVQELMSLRRRCPVDRCSLADPKRKDKSPIQ